jgi:hypothetical protein
MSRQAPVKPTKAPLPPLNGEEVCFWLHILEDHATFLRAGLLGAYPALADKAKNFHQEIHTLRCRAEQSRKVTDIVCQALPVLMNFYQFQRQILNQMIICQMHSSLYPLQLDHLIRENGYAIRLFEKISIGPRTIVNTTAQENLFWVRIMEDHTQFMGDLIDPSERNIVATARSFTREFDELYLQGRDFVSLLDRCHQDVPAFLRYLGDTRRALIRLRDFKTMAVELICECRLVGILPQALADHLRREAEHYLMILAMFQKNMIDQEAVSEEELLMAETEIDGFCSQETAESEFVTVQDKPCCKAKKPKYPYQYGKTSKLLLADEEERDQECEEKEIIDTPQPIIVPVVSIAERESAPVPQPTEALESEVEQELKVEAEPKSSRAKWSGQWPRPLGKKGK